MMPIHHRKYRDAGERQHNGQGTSPEPIQHKITESIYDQTAREYRAMLMSKGTKHDPSGNRGPNPCPRNFLLPESAGRDGILREYQDVSEPTGYEGREDREIHSSPSPSAGQESGSYERGSCLEPLFTPYEEDAVRFPARVHIGIFCIALSVVLTAFGAVQLLGYIFKAVTR
jgi:hypothetical protein